MPATSVTRSFTTQVALTLDKVRGKVVDQVSRSNAFMFFYKKKGNYDTVNSGGDRLRVKLRHTLQPAQPMGNFSLANVNPIDGVTAGFYDWRQAASAATVGDLDEFKTRGTEASEKMVEEVIEGAISALEDLFSKALLQGHGAVDGSSLATAYTAADGSVFIDPIPLLIKYDTTTATLIGSVDQSANTWWRNQTTNSAASGATSLATFLFELDFLRIKCGRGGGGVNRYPDFHVCDEQTFACYQRALRLIARLPDYRKGDIPFNNVEFYGNPVIADENVPDVENGSTTITDGTWYMGNSEFMGMMADKQGNFTAQDSVRPNNQLADTTLVVWRGTHYTDHRRKLGVMGDIDVATLQASAG
jgi:hypothetical protein